MSRGMEMRLIEQLFDDVRHDPPFEAFEFPTMGTTIMPIADPGSGSYLTTTVGWIVMRGEKGLPTWEPNSPLPREDGKAVDMGNGWFITPVTFTPYTSPEDVRTKIEKAKEILRAARPTS